MRRITVFDNNDFELMAKEIGLEIDSKKEWKKYLDRNSMPPDLLLEYDDLNNLLIKFIGGFEKIDQAYEIIKAFESNHPERYDNIKQP